MDIKLVYWFRTLGYLLIFLFSISFYYGQDHKDTIKTWVSKYANFANFKTSEDGQWLLMRKLGYNDLDTVFVFGSQSRYMAHDTITKMNVTQNFIGNNALLVVGDAVANYMDLKSSRRLGFENVKKTALDPGQNIFFILDKNNCLRVYDKSASLLRRYEGVLQIYTQPNKEIIALQEKDGVKSFFKPLKDENPFFETSANIQSFKSIDHNQWFLIENLTNKDKELSLINTQKRSKINVSLGNQQYDYISIYSLKDEYLFLVDFTRQVRPNKSEIVDVWYTNDEELRSKKYGKTIHNYWIWDTIDNNLTPWSTDRLVLMLPLKENAGVLMYNNLNKGNYEQHSPNFEIYLHNILKNESTKIFSDTREVISSESTHYIVALNEFSKKWSIYYTKEQKAKQIEITGLKSPVFSKDEKFLFFESNNGFWIFDIVKKKLRENPVLKGQKIRIKNATQLMLSQFEGPQFITKHVDSKQVLLKAEDINTLEQAIFSYQEGEVKTLISPRQDNIKDARFFPKSQQLLTLQESFNRPPSILSYDLKNANIDTLAHVLYDRDALKFKRDILSYQSKKGKNLKSILFYPKNFSPEKRYPMVVHVYEEQSNLANQYLLPQIDNTGFNVRLLLERGYFVLLPDIKMDKEGQAGVTALDAINAALDETQKLKFINQNKIGLIGHSFGGYVTNYIATRSNRFATFIVGAGASSIFTKYYKFNEDLQLPEYARVENAQFAMKEALVNNKNAYMDNDPLSFVDKVSAPMLLWCGLDDKNSTPDETMAMYLGLMRNNLTAVALFYPNNGHVLNTYSKASIDLNYRILDWWEYFLKDNKTIEWVKKIEKKDAN
ncbi:alpha/beta hydrolase family protein [Soonwooa purpurea]